jgi:3-methyl-2-oxobutanoate hydroxymethyltransferase
MSVADNFTQTKPRLTLSRLHEKKAQGEPIVMVTAYDYPGACICEEAGVDIVLVGDSGAMCVLGYQSTVSVSVEEMLVLAKAVRRGLKTPLLVADLPFGSYEVSDSQAIETAQRFVKEAGCDAVKLERGGVCAKRAQAIGEAGIPVMGHIGLTPQTSTVVAGYRSQGRTAQRAAQIIEEGVALGQAGCFSIVLEAVSTPVTEALMTRATVPIIGIGAGPSCDGQVLVFHDLLGIQAGHVPRFVKRYAQLRQSMIEALAAYALDVRQHNYPTAEHSYSMAPEETQRLGELLASE